MEEISQIIRDIVGSIDNTITGVFDSGNTTDYCLTKWARPGKTVIDTLSNEYIIDVVNVDESLEVTQTSPPPLVDLTGVTFLPAPFFQTGTKIAAKSEWAKVKTDLLEKTPLIWLLEIITERGLAADSSLEFETELRIFFLDECDVTQNTTEDNRREVVLPMKKLALEFLATIRKNRIFKRVQNYDLKTFSRFGTEDDTGVIQNILDANLSGVELRFTLSKYKDKCKNC